MIKRYIKRYLEAIADFTDTSQPPQRSPELLTQIHQTTMEYTTLGRTGLKVSVMGLGSGGYSQIGQKTGKSKKESVELVRTALDFGINFLDTAEAYHTEHIIGKAIQPIPREQVILSTKKNLIDKDRLITSKELAKGIDNSLYNLRSDYIDIYNLHGVKPDQYDYILTELVPILFKMRDAGKIRFIGITESFIEDPSHQMLQRAVQDNCWDTLMLGFNILNQSARKQVLPQAIEKKIGVLAMFAVRRALSNQENLKQAILRLKNMGYSELEDLDRDNPLGFLFHEQGAKNITDAAYRFSRHQPGINLVLFGTGNLDHLSANITSLLSPPLPSSDTLKLNQIFTKVDDFTGN